ncbi:cytochrome c oxidase subunit I [Caldalkalibacillus salinus]|uniref:cytochrome c oxidase subunit I n=1 Tax=Caldalkalibacillus salinus TaxID=2803787 RepID=UPI001920EAE0|nr:cytochrome c oxidase subunit I [Caldalkalibacillus salinus]
MSQAKKYTGVMDWLTTVDHKKIGILYLVAGAFFFLLGGIEAMLIRFQLMFPMNDLIGGEAYNQILTMHGTTMIFLAAMPILFGFMNVIIPLQIGARDVAYPFVNALGFWLFLAGGIILNVSWFMGGAPDAGWTAYVPLSTDFSGSGVDFYVLGLQVSGIGTLIGGINFLVTIINMRAPGMTFMRMPLFTWSSFIASGLILFAFPALTVGLALLMFDRVFGTAFFDPGLGGNVILWQHIFWIFGHPEVYILILPAFGIISEVIATFSRKRLFGYTAMVFATLLIGFLGFMVWVHHMFTVGLGPVANAIFAVLTMAIAVPTGIKIFNWLFTMWGGQIRFNTASLFAIGFIPTFVMGGVTGVMLSVPPADYQYHDTYFVVAHFHYVIVGGLAFGLFAAAFYWWPKIFGRMLSERLGKWTFWTFFFGFHFTFFPQHFLGLLGMPRRYFTYMPGQGLELGNMISTIGAIGMAVGSFLFIWNIIVSHRKGAEQAPADPWDGRTLEWSISSPPPEYNFKQSPLVRGIDTLWLEKMAGNKNVTPAEPLSDIHMPSPTIVPLFMSIGLFIAGLSLALRNWLPDVFQNAGIEASATTVVYVGAGVGIGITLICMLIRSLYDDHGYHIHVDELEDDGDKGVKA